MDFLKLEIIYEHVSKWFENYIVIPEKDKKPFNKDNNKECIWYEYTTIPN